jgi:hypothetical protein
MSGLVWRARPWENRPASGRMGGQLVDKKAKTPKKPKQPKKDGAKAK